MVRMKMGNLTPSEEKILEFVEASPGGRHMLDKVAKAQSTKVAYSTGCKHLSDYLKKPLSQIIQEYQADVKANSYAAFDKWENIFDDFAIYLEKQRLSSASVALYHAGAKALINANVPRSLKLQAETPKRSSRTIQGVSIEDLKQIFAICDVRERAIIAFLKDSGMSRADALTLNIRDLKGYEKQDFVHLQVYRGKEKVEYETFIGPDALQALRAYFRSRTIRGETLTQESPIFANDYKPFGRLTEENLSTIFSRIEKATSLTISSHKLRKFFETYMALIVRHPIVLKYWMGHKIGQSRDIESRYIIPPTPEQEKLYRESYKNISLTGATLEEMAQAAAKAEFAKMLTEEQKQLAIKAGIKFQKTKPKPKEEIEEVEKFVAERKKDCRNGHCQKIVTEQELPSFLEENWRIVASLPSGKLVIEY
jgi:integrase